MTDAYIQAVVSKLRAGAEPKTVLTGLQTVLRHRHHEKLLPHILRGVLRILAAEPHAAVAHVQVASAADAQVAAVQESLAALSAPDTPVVTTDASLIGGHVVRYNGRQIDHSYKAKLVELYRQVTQ